MAFFRRKYGDYHSLYGKVRVALAMLSVFPLLAVLVLFLTLTRMNEQMLLFVSALVLLSILSGFSLLRTSADQLGELADQTKGLKVGLKGQSIEVEAGREMNDIAASINVLLSEVASMTKENKEQTVQLMVYARDLSDSYAKLKAQIELRNQLSRYVGDNLVEKLKNNLTFESERRELTVLFVDIRSFTAISEQMTAEEVVAMLNEYFDTVVDIILDNNGHLDKFVGDEIMAVFGVVPSRNHAARDAVSAALAMQQKTQEFMKTRSEQGRTMFQVGIGINSGEVIVGNVGSKNRMDYTVIGDAVNTAARLQQLADGGEIVIGEETFRQTREDFDFLEKGTVHLKNKAQPVTYYQVRTTEMPGPA